jgi:hypothetical protein
MRIQLWSAFASNNSGSYTIVGSFRSDEIAVEVAAELRAVLDAHQQWFDAQDRPAESPLDAWCAKHDLPRDEPPGRDDDWPAYGKAPQVGAVGHQVILHVAYTVTMAPVFGAYFYRRNGRVDTELDHAHAPLVWLHEISWPWRERDEAMVAASRIAVLDAAFAPDGPLVAGLRPTGVPSWEMGTHFIEPDLRIAVVWRDPVEGATQLDALVRRHGAGMSSRVIEALDDRNPTASLLPCTPPVAGLFDLVLRDAGPTPGELARALSSELFGTSGVYSTVVEMVDGAPSRILGAKPRAIVDALVAKLADTGAVLEIVARE